MFHRTRIAPKYIHALLVKGGIKAGGRTPVWESTMGIPYGEEGDKMTNMTRYRRDSGCGRGLCMGLWASRNELSDATFPGDPDFNGQTHILEL